MNLDNLEIFSVPIKDSIFNWVFKDENENLPSNEFQDQIFILSKEAANYLWTFEMNLGLDCTNQYFKNVQKFDAVSWDEQKIKKFLFDLGIPFDKKIYISIQPDMAFILTWKMVIKYSDRLFVAWDLAIHDHTYNWQLQFHHDDIFTFGKDLIYDAQSEILKMKELKKQIQQEIDERKSSTKD